MKENRKPILKICSLSAGYKNQDIYNEVLKNVSFDVHAGELICLMGPNGAGKSTLLRCLSGLQKYSAGEVILDGKLMINLSPAERSKKMAVVLTEQIAASHMTVKSLIAMGRYPHLGWMLRYSQDDDRIIEQMADDCGISHLLHKNVHSLSDGQRQKALIARALVQESELLILDEPTSHLDLNNRVEIIRLLKEISRKEGKAIIMATHELDLALQMTDRLLLLNNGGNISQGIPEDMVLNGQIDDVFAFKGYDLKTGRVEHPRSERKINLKGEGHVFLWTKNALEREGFILDKSSDDIINIHQAGDALEWVSNSRSFKTLESLLEHLNEKGH